ncbi:hypothetical protein ACVBEH_26980, partial [Roseateles sp. GG27B]
MTAVPAAVMLSAPPTVPPLLPAAEAAKLLLFVVATALATLLPVAFRLSAVPLAEMPPATLVRVAAPL